MKTVLSLWVGKCALLEETPTRQSKGNESNSALQNTQPCRAMAKTSDERPFGASSFHFTTQPVHNRTRAHQKHASLTHHPDSPHIPIHNTFTCPKERETMAESARDSKALPQHHAHLPITPISPLHKRTPQHTQPTRSNSTHKRSVSLSRVSVPSRKERCVENGGERSSKNIFRKGNCAILGKNVQA